MRGGEKGKTKEKEKEEEVETLRTLSSTSKSQPRRESMEFLRGGALRRARFLVLSLLCSPEDSGES